MACLMQVLPLYLKGKLRLLEALEVVHTNKLNTYDVFPAWQIRLIAASNVFIHERRCQFFG